MVKNKDLCTLPEGIPGPQPGARAGDGSAGRDLLTGAFFMGSSQAQPERETWVCRLVGPPPTGGDIDIQYYVNRVVVKGRGLGGLIAVPGC